MSSQDVLGTEKKSTPLFGLRTLRKELIWYYVGVFLGTGSAGWSMWINIDNALVPVTADVYTHGVLVTRAWGWEQYTDKYVLMALLLGGITTIGAFLITHYGRFLGLWSKKKAAETGEEKVARWWNRSMIIGALVVILGAEVLGRGLVYFTNPSSANGPETWFLAIASLLFFMIPALLSPSVEQIYEQDAMSSEEQDQNLKVKELNEWRRKQLIREYKRKVKPPFWLRFHKKGAFAHLAPDEIAAQIDAITPGARKLLVKVSEEETEVSTIITGQVKILSEATHSLNTAILELPEQVSNAMSKLREPAKTIIEDQPPIPPNNGGGMPIEEQITAIEEAEEVLSQYQQTEPLPVQTSNVEVVRKSNVPAFDFSLLDEKEIEPEPLPDNVRAIRTTVQPVLVKKKGRPRGSTKAAMAERREAIN